MLSSEPGTIATRSPIASSSDASSVAPRRRRRDARRAAPAKRNACGVWARNRPSRGTVAAIRPSATRFSVSATGTAGIAPGSVLQRREQGRDGARRDQRPRRVVHQHDIRRLRPPAPPARRARCPGAWRRPAPAAGAASRSSAASIAAGVADRLQQVDVRGQRLGGVADHRLAGERQELLRRLGAEPAARPGGDQDGCDSHAGTVAAADGVASTGARCRGIHIGRLHDSPHGRVVISHCTSACVSLICPI